MTAVSVRDLRFHYPGSGAFALHVAQLSLAHGARAACIGPSGSGKTTLVNLVAGIAVPESGEVRHDGVVVSALDDAARRAHRIAHIGLLFQELELLDYLSALDNILLPYHVSRLRLDDAVRARAGELARAAGVGHLLRRRPAALSQGERQRVAICRALVTRPSLVLCDEPTGNLDPHTAGVVLDLLFDSVRACGATLLMVTHDHTRLDRFDVVVDMAALHAAAPTGSSR